MRDWICLLLLEHEHYRYFHKSLYYHGKYESALLFSSPHSVPVVLRPINAQHPFERFEPLSQPPLSAWAQKNNSRM
ncbi:Uncharacterised protein [Vibrio cholerae]|uniref:Uncharacterized protein n=1 Tax=Vibrio cholerae TaxID=666 RepID=A0A655Z6Y9_VIBCL|nr:Uncharacterised protein [Vibrio cholerae]